jgi:hypothetical protein
MELLKTIATSWPFWIFVLAIVFIFMFRSDIKNLLSRTTRIGPAGLTVSDTPSKETQAHAAADVSPVLAVPAPPPTDGAPAATTAAIDPADAILVTLDDSYIRQKEQELLVELNNRGINDTNKKLRLFPRLIAAAFVVTEYERAEGAIWGSQLQILAELNSSATLPAAQLHPFYEAARPQAPEAFAQYPFENYMDFLKTQGFVTEADHAFTITDKGRQYLVWRLRVGKKARKPY